MLIDPEKLRWLAERILNLDGPDRDLDADIAEHALGWKPAQLAVDYDGANACEILTPNGKLYGDGFQYPPKGQLHRAYHVPRFTADTLEALRFCGLRPDGPFARRILAEALIERANQRDHQTTDALEQAGEGGE